MDIPKLSLTSILNGGSFSRKLEGFLHSDSAGKKTIYRDVPEELSERNNLIHNNLDVGGIKALTNYSGYYTAFSYNDRARFVNGVAAGISTISAFLKKDTVA